MPRNLKNTIIHLNGFPGTGKYTVAKEIVKQADVRLVDNHLINNPVFSLMRLDGKTEIPESAWVNIRVIRQAVLDTMARISPAEYNFVMTNVLFDDDPGDHDIMARVMDIVRQRQSIFVPVKLVISDVAEHVKRITDPARETRMKETDPDAPARYAQSTLLKTDHPNLLVLDVTALPPAESARAILAHTAQSR